MTYDPEVEAYRKMQHSVYNSFPADDNYMRQAIVGCFAEHEGYPYEKYLLARLDPDKMQDMFALDFGCGPGRMIRRLAPLFYRVDGVDISATCLETARRWTADLPHQPVLYLNDGVVLGGEPETPVKPNFFASERVQVGVESGVYCFVYSTIAYHHIASYPIRMSLLREFYRVLRPGGHLAIQMFYTTTPREKWAQHVSWRESNHAADRTNGYCDVRITPENLREVEEDFHSVGFGRFGSQVAPYPDPPHPKTEAETDFIFLYARKPCS